jgi:hypothetical protein
MSTFKISAVMMLTIKISKIIMFTFKMTTVLLSNFEMWSIRMCRLVNTYVRHFVFLLLDNLMLRGYVMSTILTVDILSEH